MAVVIGGICDRRREEGESKSVNLLTRVITESGIQHIIVVIIYTSKQKDHYCITSKYKSYKFRNLILSSTVSKF